jgi:hypothetical protein
MKEPDHNLIGQLLFMEETGMKPNFSALQKEYGIDRHTIKKYYENGGKRYKKRPPVPSKYDPYEKEAAGLLANPSSSIMAAWHPLEGAGPINYSESDYMEAMAASCRDGADISAMAEESLSRLASLGGD